MQDDGASLLKDKTIDELIRRLTQTEVQMADPEPLGEKEQIFNEIVRRYRPRISIYCFRVLGGSRDDVEDAAQEVFFRAYKGLYSFRLLPGHTSPSSAFSAWLHGIALNVLRNIRRRELSISARFPLPEFLTSEDVRFSSISPHPDMTDVIEEASLASLRDAIFECIKELTPRDREIIMGKLLEGPTMRPSSSSDRSRLSRARSKLKSLLKEKYPDLFP